MSRTHTRATRQPGAAERLLSVLTTAHSANVVCDGLATELRRLDGGTAIGRFHLHDPAPERHTSNALIPVRLEFTDVAPTPVRDRVRTRVTLTGLLAEPFDESAETTCTDARVPFSTPLTDPCQASAAIQGLLARARRTTHARHLPA
ncbi:hypothetical protein ACWGB8_05920 [Kitasatospora sp. NPDC054939]